MDMHIPHLSIRGITICNNDARALWLYPLRPMALEKGVLCTVAICG